MRNRKDRRKYSRKRVQEKRGSRKISFPFSPYTNLKLCSAQDRVQNLVRDGPDKRGSGNTWPRDGTHAGSRRALDSLPSGTQQASCLPGQQRTKSSRSSEYSHDLGNRMLGRLALRAAVLRCPVHHSGPDVASLPLVVARQRKVGRR